MAANPIVVPITPPRVAFLTPNGFIAREWYRFLLSLATQAAVGTEDVDFLLYAPDTASALETGLADVRQTLNTLPPTAQDPLLLATRQALDQLPPAATVDQLAVLQASIDALAASPASGAYSVASGVTSIANGGTGVSSTPANGQIDIGNGLGFTRTTLTAGSGVSISNTSGAISISATGTGGTVTSVAQSFTGGLISVAGSPITTSGTLALTVAGTSGGIPYFASGTTWATSAALAANAIVLGGGAGAAPATTPTGTGVVTALGVNTGAAGAFVVNGGALGTPSSGTVTNLTGTANININGTVGATTPATGSFTTVKTSTGASVGGATPGAGGLAFPATAVAVADANTLDDYEEGACAITLSPGSGSITASSVTANYTKIGRLVTITGILSVSNNGTGGGGVLNLDNLPFTPSSNSAGVGREGTMTGLTVVIYISSGSTSANMFTYANAYPVQTGSSVNFMMSYIT